LRQRLITQTDHESADDHTLYQPLFAHCVYLPANRWKLDTEVLLPEPELDP
jgi:hypothetical protein